MSNLRNFVEFCAYSKNDILWGVPYIYQCWLVFLCITVKPEVSSFFCDRFYSYIMKTNDTAWPKVKSSSVERGHNHLTQRAITLLIFRFMSRNFLWWRIYSRPIKNYQFFSSSYKDIHYTRRKSYICPKLRNFIKFCAYSWTDIFWAVPYIHQCWLAFLGITVKPEVSSFFCDRFYTFMTKNNNTEWPKVKSSSVEMGHNHFIPRAITHWIVRFMRRNFLW